MTIPKTLNFIGLGSSIQSWPHQDFVENTKDMSSIGSIEALRLSSSYFESEDEYPLKKCQNKSTTVNEQVTREILLYLIRHGEAEHNVVEKIAMEEALKRSLRETGRGPECPVTAQTMQEARKSVLQDESLRDAKLSELGRSEALEARNQLASLQMEPPSCVLVSPLTRTLETASIVFPEHDNCKIRVRDDLSERRTGMPPDIRSSVGSLCLRRSFRRFSMNRLRNQEESMSSLEHSDSTFSESTTSTSDLTSPTSSPTTCSSSRKQPFQDRCEGRDFSFVRRLQSSMEENRAELRRRTERLFGLLGETQDSSVAVVTHKGYLRELEKGPLDQTNVQEFDNGEIRVYKVVLSTSDHQLLQAERVC